MRLGATARSAAANGVVDLIDVGAATAVLEAWSGSRPASVGGAPAGTKLASFDLPEPCFGAASSGVATANAITGTTGLADGTVGFVQVTDQDANVLWDNDDVGVGSGQVQFNTLAISTGVDVDVTSWTVTMPAS
jgi:hypothetical protein